MGTGLAGRRLYWHSVAIAILPFLVAFGAFYRLATTLFLVASCYVFLPDQVRCLNHVYLVILATFLLIVVPANRA